MDSHILNMYHQARYRTIGHKIMRSTSNSLSSESSNQNSPEYKIQSGFGSTEQDWRIPSSQNTNTTQSNHDTSSEDEEENIEVHEVSQADSALDYATPATEEEAYEDCSLVEGDDYDVIQVYAVHPDLDLEASSEDDDDEEKDECTDGEYLNLDDASYRDHNYERPDNRHPEVIHEGININLDTPVVSNVDEYFIKDTKDILDVKDEPVVNDVDEYFIKETDRPQTPDVDDLFIKRKLSDEQPFRIDKPIPTVPENFLAEEPKEEIPEPEPEVEPQLENPEVSINESDLEVLPNIEDLKRYLLEDMTCSKFKHAQRSCSVPHSPMNICMDIDDAKTCLSFEDLNLDLSDLAFDNDKDKSDGSANKSDDIPRTLTEEDVNSFLITNQTEAIKNEDDLSMQDMEIEQPLESSIPTTITSVPELPSVTPEIRRTSTPIPKPAVLEYCIEKSAIKNEPISDIKVEVDDFVDVESCNDAVIPVLEANNLSSLLEQFEATEKLNPKKKSPLIKVEEQKVKSLPKTSLTNGMRLQDAGVQLNKNKMRQILMPPTIKTAVRRSPSPVHSDHDYCSSKKRHSLPNLKGGQSLLKPEVLSSNNRILNSRHRSCKNKKVVYHLSSDDESEKCNNNNKNKKIEKLNRDDSDVKTKKNSVKQPVKPVTLPVARKKLYNDSVVDSNGKSNNSVMNKSACKASDNPCSQNSNGSIKLTIKNKSEVILNCDDKDSQKDSKIIDKHKSSSVSDKTSNTVKSKPAKDIINAKDKDIKEVDSNKSKYVNNSENVCNNVKETHIKEEPKSKDENFYTALFSNKQDVKVPQVIQVKSEKRLFEEELQRISEETIKKELEQPAKKKKLNLQEYKMRRVNSNNSSATVSPEAIFPEMPHLNLDKVKPVIQTTPALNNTGQTAQETPKEVFDPIREASRKILMNTKKQKAEAMRKRDEDIVMSKIPKVENLELQPLISDAEMMKIVGMTPAEELPIPIEKPIVPEKPEKQIAANSDYVEIILVSVGTNTDEKVFRELEKQAVKSAKTVKTKAVSPTADAKALINFKIKKADHVLKQNVFDNVKRDKKSPVDDKKHAEPKIDKARYKDITAALKSVEKQVDTKISSNSLFASIQDVVLKKAPEESERKSSKPSSPTDKKAAFEYVKATIVRDYDAKVEHGEDKIILHLEKDRNKPDAASIIIQTDIVPEYSELSVITAQIKEKIVNRKRNDSDMSMSSDSSPVESSQFRTKELKTPANSDKKVVAKPKSEVRQEKRSLSKEKRSRSKERYDKYRRRSRSPSRGRRRKRSYTRSRSRSRGRYRRYRRSDSPYKRKRRSRSPYRRRSSSRRSPKRRDRSVRSNRSRTPRRDETTPARSPVPKKCKPSPHSSEKKLPVKSMTPPLRKPTVSESSDSSSSSSSSSSSTSSSSSAASRKSRSSCSPYERDEPYRKKYRSFSSEDRESNTPVEERRIVFVGKLEKDINKTTLRGLFSKFGPVMEVRLHSKEDGTRYGFVTYQRARDAWSAVEAASTFPQYDVGFGGRRAFCRQSYADLDGLEAKYTESAFHGAAAPPARRHHLSFEEMLQEMRNTLSQRHAKDKKRHDDKP